MSDTPLKMPCHYRAIVTKQCAVCGKEIVGLKRLTYCKPEKGKTKSKCAIYAAAAQLAAKKKDKK
jgi:hypothetical protein